MANPKNSNYYEEVRQWLTRASAREQKELQERREKEIADRIDQATQAAYSFGNSLSSGSGLMGGLGSALSAGQQNALQLQAPQNQSMYQYITYSTATSGLEVTPAVDPHTLLTDQITALKSVTPAKVGKRMPDYCHTLTSYRGWQIRNEKLSALGQTNDWKPKTAKPAKCSNGSNHRAPSRDCGCGYWSFKSMDQLTAALRSYSSSVVVVGEVEIWGRVIECENGYRSEFAYPKELWLLKPDLDYLSQLYGVPVRQVPV